MDRAELARLLGTSLATGESRDVVVCEREPERFLSRFGEAVAAGGRVFLADPAWGQQERAQFAALTAEPAPPVSDGWLCIPTGGSSGRLKLARHDEQTIAAAVLGFSEHFGKGPINAVGLLPLHHVSGLMAWMRCVLTGGTYLPWDGRRLLAGERPLLGPGNWFLSLVPTQLARLLDDAAAVTWLRGFCAVFVGGGPVWPALVDAGAALRLPLAFSYGMTETAAMVAALRPAEFLEGARGCGRPLPHAEVIIDPEGVIEVSGVSLFRGYYPATLSGRGWRTEDLGRWDDTGSLQVLGRRDGFIISGGEKIDPLEVEGVLRKSGAFTDVAVIGVPDPEWGEAVVACYPAGVSPDLLHVQATVASDLAPYKQPKRYVPVRDWPRNEQGKLNRATLRAVVSG